jgi:archaellum component FlaC
MDDRGTIDRECERVEETMNELASFHQFLSVKMNEFGSRVSPEEVLDLWRATHPSKFDFEQDVKAVQEALDDMQAGDGGIPVNEFDAGFRRNHPIA